jgi:cytochrome c peroxidase
VRKLGVLITIIFFIACNKDAPLITTPYQLNYPAHFPSDLPAANNALSIEGVALGKLLFYDAQLSKNNNISCASCHLPQYAFADSGIAVSPGNGIIVGKRNAPPLFNMAFIPHFFWDGGVPNIESTILVPINNETEMANSLVNVLQYLNGNANYRKLFQKIYGIRDINAAMVLKVLAQFQRTLISSNSKYDRWIANTENLSSTELQGLQLFKDTNKGNCNGCHSLENLGTDNRFHNIGLDSTIQDVGRYRITLNNEDSGKFKTPSVRNLKFTPPYMHDGRFTTLAQVLALKNNGFKTTTLTDTTVIQHGKNKLTNAEMLAIETFLETLNDYSFVTNPAFAKP